MCLQTIDIDRVVSVYPDKAGLRWWTKAWFNNSTTGERAVEIEEETAVRFIHDKIGLDEMMETYFPKQMDIYHEAIEQTREQMLSQMTI